MSKCTPWSQGTFWRLASSDRKLELHLPRDNPFCQGTTHFAQRAWEAQSLLHHKNKSSAPRTNKKQWPQPVNWILEEEDSLLGAFLFTSQSNPNKYCITRAPFTEICLFMQKCITLRYGGEKKKVSTFPSLKLQDVRIRKTRQHFPLITCSYC